MTSMRRSRTEPQRANRVLFASRARQARCRPETENNEVPSGSEASVVTVHGLEPTTSSLVRNTHDHRATKGSGNLPRGPTANRTSLTSTV